MNEKKFYWIKLKTDFFNQDTIDFLLQQENGCKYIVLYQMLCLKTANNNGELNTKIGEMIIPYNIEKIQRDTKYFDIDTVRVALELFKQLGLILIEENNILRISNFDDMVGSESKWAEQKRIYRKKQKENLLGQSKDIVRQEIEYRDRDKSIDKDIDIDIINNNNSGIPTVHQKSLFDVVEENFGRTLNPIEYEEISKWEDNELTRYAIKEAILNGARSVKYINTILASYKAKNILTVEEAIKDKERYKKGKEPTPEWLDKKIEKKEASEEEKKEIEAMLNEFKEED